MADNKNISEYGDDPFGAYNFWVEIDGEDGIKARFMEVSGLKGEAQEFEIKEGGLNYRTHLIPGPIKWGPVTLKKGLADDTAFEDWFTKTVKDPANCRKNVAIVLMDRDMSEIQRWSLREAWPKSWEGTNLNAGGSEMAIETVVLNHHGVTEFTNEG